MSHPMDIKRLYYGVLFKDIALHSVKDDDIRAAIDNMNKVYKPLPESLSSATSRSADYNTVAHRCAYLHKYAPFHTAMVQDILMRILYQNPDLFWTFRHLPTSSKFKICSLGGGPGSDIVGAISALTAIFGVFPCSAKVVDLKSDWKDTLRSVIHELGSRDYGIVGQCFKPRNFDWEYLTADLLEDVESDVVAAIGRADLVTMVKFVSAAACLSTEAMLKKIFMMLKTGAMVLFIDNGGGGFRQLVSNSAANCGLRYVFGPIPFETYTNPHFDVSYFDYVSCFSTTVTIHMLQKLKGNGNEAKNIFPNKRIKSAVYESSKYLREQNLNDPQSSSSQEPGICCQGGNKQLNPVRAEGLVEKISTPIAHAGVSRTDSASTVKDGIRKTHINNNSGVGSPQPKAGNENTSRVGVPRTVDSALTVKDGIRKTHINNNSGVGSSQPKAGNENTSRVGVPRTVDSALTVKDGIRKTHINNNSGVGSSQPKAGNENTSRVGVPRTVDSALTVKDGIRKTHINNNSGVGSSQPKAGNENTARVGVPRTVDSAPTVKKGIKRPYIDNNSGVVNFQPKTVNKNTPVCSYGSIVNFPPKGNPEKVNSFRNDLPTATRVPNKRSSEHLNAETAVFPLISSESEAVNSEMDKENYLKKDESICSTSTMSLRQDSFSAPILQETSANPCCSSCVIL